MRIISFFLLGLLLMEPLFSQVPSKKEIEAQMQQSVIDLKKQITDQEKLIAEAKASKEDPETIKSMEDELVRLKQQLAMMEKAGKSITTIPSSIMNKAEEEFKNENDDTFSSIPPKKIALLNALPKDGLSKTELSIYLNNLYTELKQKLPAQRVADVQKIITGLKNDLTQIAFSGVAAWYNNSPAQAALLMTYAASKSPGDANTLNNCGAILNLCGLEHKAIPILKYVLVSHPANSTVLNNLGQAYAGLGDKQTAMMYFARCIRQSPNHPEANATAAKIAEANGDMEKALEYTEQSLKGAFSPERADFFRNKQKGCKVNVLFDTKSFSKIQYFEPGSITFPRNCRTWADCESVYQEQQAFNKTISTLAQKYEQQTLDNQVSMAEIQAMGESPFNNAALFKKEILGNCYVERRQELMEDLLKKTGVLVEQNTAEQIALEEKYEAEFNACPEIRKAECQDRATYKYCQEKKALENKYFSLLADISEEFKNKSYIEDVGYYNSIVYLESVSYTNDKVLAQVHGVYTRDLLYTFQSYILSTGCNPVSKPNCEQYNPANAQNPNSPYFKDPQCPIGIKLGFGVGEVSLSCKSFGIEVGQGVKFGYEKDFITKESTLSMGPGVSADIPGIMDAGANVKAYVKFDGNNQPIDVGLAGEASAGIIGMSPFVSAGYTMGVNSGFNYSGKSPF